MWRDEPAPHVRRRREGADTYIYIYIHTYICMYIPEAARTGRIRTSLPGPRRPIAIMINNTDNDTNNDNYYVYS